MRLKTLLLFPAVMLLGLASVAYAGSLATLATPGAATFSAVSTDRSAGTLRFGVNLFGVDGSVGSINFLKLRNGTGGVADAKDNSTGLMRQLMPSSIGVSSGNIGGWGEYPHVLVGRHYILVPDPRIACLGILWPRMVQWRKL